MYLDVWNTYVYVVISDNMEILIMPIANVAAIITFVKGKRKE